MASASSRATIRLAPTIPPNAETESHMNARRYALVISLSDATPHGFWCLMIATVGWAKSVATRHAALMSSMLLKLVALPCSCCMVVMAPSSPRTAYIAACW